MGEVGDYELESRKTCLLIFIQGSKSNASPMSPVSNLKSELLPESEALFVDSVSEYPVVPDVFG